MQTPGKLFLIPNHLGENPREKNIHPEVIAAIDQLDGFLAENPKSCRSFLKQVGIARPLPSFEYFELNKRSSNQERESYLKLLKQGKNLGVISEAGCPGIADPGAEMVALAHANGISVLPLIGASSILLALIASGIGGQQFTFHGYIPIDDKAQKSFLSSCLDAANKGYTQLVMETPYRNLKLYKSLLQVLPAKYKLCIAANLTQEDEWVKTLRIEQWKKQPEPAIHKIPAIFVFGN